MNRNVPALATLLVLSMLTLIAPARAQVAAVPQLLNFQGRLSKPDGTPVANGTYSVRFSLWDALTGGTEKWNQTVGSVPVKNGTFAVLLSGFPVNTFNSNLWLEIKVGSSAALTPRQQLASVAYSMKADTALTVPDASITNAKLAGGITGDKFAASAFNSLAWLLNGNSGVLTGFLGTTDNNPLELRVNNRRAVRYSYAENTASPGSEYRSANVLGGSDINTIGPNVVGATLTGGGWDSFTSTDFPNSITGNFGTIGGGFGSIAAGQWATVSGGGINAARGFASTIGGGGSNNAVGSYTTIGGGGVNNANGDNATIGGGTSNNAGGNYTTIGGGLSNTTSNDYTTIGGGGSNIASGIATTVGGGYHNTASGTFSTVGGGDHNIASGSNAIVVGGARNTASGNGAVVLGGNDSVAAGDFSFAFGGHAKANHFGSFVWRGADGLDFASTGNRQFLISASGGVGIGTNNPAGYALNVNGSAIVTSLTQSSDGRWKQNVTDLMNPLDAILNLRGVSYEWKRDTSGMNFPDGRQIGFIAQEVEKVLPELVTTDTKGYKSVAYQNIVPVLVEAIKTQQRQRQADKAEIAELKKENTVRTKRLTEIEAKNAELEARLDHLEAILRNQK